MTAPAAFPGPPGSNAKGMSLRDYFAAKAMQTLLHDLATLGKIAKDHPDDFLADAAYNVADAMLRRREAK